MKERSTRLPLDSYHITITIGSLLEANLDTTDATLNLFLWTEHNALRVGVWVEFPHIKQN